METEQLGENQENPIKQSLIFDKIKERVSRKKNCLIAIVGSTGSGKSYTALSFGEQLDPEFDISRVAFTPQEFLDLVERGNNDLPSGSVIILDEGQLSVSSREWLSLQNKIINQVLSTFRYKQFIVIFTMPDLSFIDSQSRKLMHMYFETISLNRTLGLATLKPFHFKIVRRMGLVTYTYPIIRTKKGVFQVKKIRVKKPSRKIVFAYEKKKRAFTKELYNQFKANIAGDKDFLDKSKQIMTPTERKYYLFRKANTTMKDEEVAVLLEKSPKYIKQIRLTCIRKGWMDKEGNVIEKVD